MFRKSAALLAALSLAASPAFAQPSAAPLSIERSAAPTADGNRLEGQNIIPAILFLAIIVGGVLLATGVIGDNHHPHSP